MLALVAGDERRTLRSVDSDLPPFSSPAMSHLFTVGVLAVHNYFTRQLRREEKGRNLKKANMQTRDNGCDVSDISTPGAP